LAAFFAANSLVRDVFVLTKSFTVHFIRPVTQGIMQSVGQVIEQDGRQISAEAVLYDASNREIGKGSGIFVHSSIPLASIPEYRIDG
jgi:acyl-coenzyme A thioesterase PaaI-like protein